MPCNHTIMQFFEWHIKPDGTHWKRLADLAPELKKANIDSVWIPPACKAQTQDDNGYSVYDVYDLGEFEQQGSVRTKYGTKEELVKAIQVCRDHGIGVYADIVMNHKAGADETERFKVVEVNPDNRTQAISEPFEIEGWTKFVFPGRQGKYSEFIWNFEKFNGTDYDQSRQKKGIYRILGDNKKWNQNVVSEYGNYDYLMFANIDYDHPAVRAEMIGWGGWLAETLNCSGFRLDAVKHINHDFVREFAAAMKKKFGDNFYMVGEFWNPNLEECRHFLDHIEYQIDLFDVPLHYKFEAASRAGKDFDLRTIFDGTLVRSNPLNAVTFVDNHDSQPGSSLESWVQDWFKASAYALILLRRDGYPVVFYGDYYGIGEGTIVPGKQAAIDPLLYARANKAYGKQDDYFDHPNLIGWVRQGDPQLEKSGCAVLISNHQEGSKRMAVGKQRAKQIWIDLTGNRKDRITVGDDGFAEFPVNGGSVSVWAEE